MSNVGGGDSTVGIALEELISGFDGANYGDGVGSIGHNVSNVGGGDSTVVALLRACVEKGGTTGVLDLE